MRGKIYWVMFFSLRCLWVYTEEKKKKHFDEFTCKIDTYMHNTPSHNNEIKRGKEWIPHCSCKWLERTKESKLNRSAAVIMISDVRFCGSFILIPFRMLITFPIFGMARIYSNWQTKDFCSQMSLEQYLCMSHKSRQTNTEFSSYLIKLRMVAAFVFLRIRRCLFHSHRANWHDGLWSSRRCELHE